MVPLFEIESVKSFEFGDIAASRDTDLNGAFITSRGLVYSEQAAQAASTGIIHTGADHFYHEGVLMSKDRGLARLVKFTAEGKALGFEIAERNLQIDLGIYYLVLAEKFRQKHNAVVLFDRMFELSRRMGAVLPGDRSFFDILDRKHSDNYAFYAFERPRNNDEWVVAWLAGKLAKQAEQLFKETFDVRRHSTIVVSPNDERSVRIELTGLSTSNADAASDFKVAWETFARMSLARNEEHERRQSALI